jgi:hypothetical protein
MVNSDGVKACPSPAMHRKLEEVHHFWHECIDTYQDPSLFIFNLNACIQATRNVTFALQKDKATIDNFEDWYKSWQEKMKTDLIMKWIIDARNEVVKRGELELNSTIAVKLIVTYNDVTRQIADEYAKFSVDEGSAQKRALIVETSVMNSSEEIQKEIKSKQIPARLLDEATISIERRWVDSKLPESELLDSLAYAFGFLSQLSEDLHVTLGQVHDEVSRYHGHNVRASDLKTLQGRPPCMITTQSIRTTSVRFRDGEPDEGGYAFPVAVDPEKAEIASKIYGSAVLNTVLPQLSRESLPQYAKEYEERAKGILQKGEDHVWMVLYFRSGTTVGSELLAARDSADKRDLARRIANNVARNDSDGVVMIGEVWLSPMIQLPDGDYVQPSEHPKRREAILIEIILADGSASSTTIPFRRGHKSGIPGRGRKVIFGESMHLDKSNYQILEPTRAVWRAKGLLKD